MGQGANCCGVSTNKESAREESHYRGRQKTAKNYPNLEIKISAYKVPLTILIFRFVLLKYFLLLPAAPSYPPDISGFAEKLAEEEEERSFSEEPTANMPKWADTGKPRALTTLRRWHSSLNHCPSPCGRDWA